MTISVNGHTTGSLSVIFALQNISIGELPLSHNSDKSSLEQHLETMKVGKIARWFFGETGGTVSPAYKEPLVHVDDHDQHEVSEAYAAFFKENPEKTDDEYQKIRRD